MRNLTTFLQNHRATGGVLVSFSLLLKYLRKLSYKDRSFALSRSVGESNAGTLSLGCEQQRNGGGSAWQSSSAHRVARTQKRGWVKGLESHRRRRGQILRDLKTFLQDFTIQKSSAPPSGTPCGPTL